jgi:hypothetical protein
MTSASLRHLGRLTGQVWSDWWRTQNQEGLRQAIWLLMGTKPVTVKTRKAWDEQKRTTQSSLPINPPTANHG